MLLCFLLIWSSRWSLRLNRLEQRPHWCGRAWEWVTICRLKWHKKSNVFPQCLQVKRSLPLSLCWGKCSSVSPSQTSTCSKPCRVRKWEAKSKSLWYTSLQNWQVLPATKCGALVPNPGGAENTATYKVQLWRYFTSKSVDMVTLGASCAINIELEWSMNPLKRQPKKPAVL